MKLFHTIIILILFSANSFAQNSFGAELQSPKPIIVINDIPYNIGYGNQSCVPKNCDSVVINAGDSITFCSVVYFTELNILGYYLQWDFVGSNMPLLLDTAPNVAPICYAPEWNTPGTYMVNIYYQGALSISTCNSVPSQWYIKVIVLSGTGINYPKENYKMSLSPNPTTGIFTVTSEQEITAIEIYNVVGEQVFHKLISKPVVSGVEPSSNQQINLTSQPKGIYFCTIATASGTATRKIVIQ